MVTAMTSWVWLIQLYAEAPIVDWRKQKKKTSDFVPLKVDKMDLLRRQILHPVLHISTDWL